MASVNSSAYLVALWKVCSGVRVDSLRRDSLRIPQIQAPVKKISTVSNVVLLAQHPQHLNNKSSPSYNSLNPSSNAYINLTKEPLHSK